jgi:hypothetical protein
MSVPLAVVKLDPMVCIAKQMFPLELVTVTLAGLDEPVPEVECANVVAPPV